MHELHQLFTQALGLVAPWQVESVDFKHDEGEIHFHIGFGERRASCAADEPRPTNHDSHYSDEFYKS